MALLLAIEGSVSSAGLFKAAKLPPDGFAQLQIFLMSHTEIANSAFTNGSSDSLFTLWPVEFAQPSLCRFILEKNDQKSGN